MKLLALLLALGLAGCASKSARTTAKTTPAKPKRSHVSTPAARERFGRIREMISACDRAGSPTISAGGKVMAPDRALVADECGGALEVSEETARRFPDDAEAAALVILAVSAAFDRDPEAASSLPPVSTVPYCDRALPWFRDRYRRTGAPDEAFNLHCADQAARAYRSAVENEQSTTGVVAAFEAGDTPQLSIKDDRGRAHTFWCFRGCAPFDTGDPPIGKRVKVFWIRERSPAAERGGGKEVPVFLRAEIL